MLDQAAQKISEFSDRQADLVALLGGVLDAAIALADADFGNIQFLEAAGQLKIVAQRNFPAWWIDYWNDAANDHGVCGASLVAGERVIVEDVEHSLIAEEPMALESMRRLGIVAIQSTPLRGQRGQLLGMFSTHYRSPGHHDEKTLKVLDLLATHAATLIERDTLERANRETEIKFRAAVECSSDGFWIVDDQLQLVDVNEVYARRSGYSADELLQMRVTDLDAEHNQESAQRRDADIRKHGYALFETTHRTKSGELWPVEVTVSYHPGPGRRAFAFLRDITKRNHLRESLRASEELFRLAMDATEEAVWDWNLSTGEAYISPAYARMLGFSSLGPDFNRTVFEHLLHPDDVHLVVDDALALLREAGRYAIEFRMRRKDGSYCWVLSRARVVERDALGNPVRAIGTHMDITARKEAQAEIQSYAAKLEGALGAMADAVSITDVEGRFVHLNPAFARFYRFQTLAECRRRVEEYPEIVEVLLPNGEELPYEQWAVFRALRGEMAVDQEYTLRRRDTGETWIGNYTLAPIRDAAGTIIGSVVTARDVTEQRAAEKARADAEVAVRSSESRLAEAQRTAHIGSFEIDLESGQTDWSDEQYRIHGLEPGESSPTVKEILARFVLPEDARELSEEFVTRSRRGEVFDRQHRIRLPDGRIRWIHTLAHASFDKQGHLRRYGGTSQDVTELRLAEETARERLDNVFRLQRLNMANELSSTLAHEINQPLAAIAIYIVVCRQLLAVPEIDRKNLLEKIDRINALSLQAGEIIRQMRSFFSKGKITPQPLDLNATIQSALALMEVSAHRKNITLNMALAANLPAVMGVGVQIEQVVLNLLRNAFDAMAEAANGGGSIAIESQQLGDKARVTITDTGPGISAEKADQLFGKIASDKVNGLGIGLSISRSLIEAHGGRLWVEPHVPGAIFHFELPLA